MTPSILSSDSVHSSGSRLDMGVEAIFQSHTPITPIKNRNQAIDKPQLMIKSLVYTLAKACQVVQYAILSIRSLRSETCPRRDSNPGLGFTGASFYPLHYGGASQTTKDDKTQRGLWLSLRFIPHNWGFSYYTQLLSV